MRRHVWSGTACGKWVMPLALAASVAACGGSKETPSTGAGTAGAPPAAGGQKVDPATAGNLKGTVTLEGTAPKNEAIKMNADPFCMKENKSPQFQETYSVGSDGKSLANVFVYVKDGLGNYVFDPPADSITIDQKLCRYHPHVFGARVGQKLVILNSDQTLHNIHALPKVNSEFNVAEPIKDMKQEHVFTAREIMVPFKCEVHGWMNAYAGIVDNPYFAVSDADGKFDIKSLPPGTYTLEAWHEKLGTTTQSVTLGQTETKEINFSFKAGATTTN